MAEAETDACKCIVTDGGSFCLLCLSGYACLVR